MDKKTIGKLTELWLGRLRWFRKVIIYVLIFLILFGIIIPIIQQFNGSVYHIRNEDYTIYAILIPLNFLIILISCLLIDMLEDVKEVMNRES